METRKKHTLKLLVYIYVSDPYGLVQPIVAHV
jgi:hypothetical protein